MVPIWPGGEIGRRAGLKIRFQRWSKGSSPFPATTRIPRVYDDLHDCRRPFLFAQRLILSPYCPPFLSDALQFLHERSVLAAFDHDATANAGATLKEERHLRLRSLDTASIAVSFRCQHKKIPQAECVGDFFSLKRSLELERRRACKLSEFVLVRHVQLAHDVRLVFFHSFYADVQNISNFRVTVSFNNKLENFLFAPCQCT